MIFLQKVREKTEDLKVVRDRECETLFIYIDHYWLPHTTVVLLRLAFKTVPKGDSLLHKTKPKEPTYNIPSLRPYYCIVFLKSSPAVSAICLQGLLILQYLSFEPFHRPILCKLSCGFPGFLGC